MTVNGVQESMEAERAQLREQLALAKERIDVLQEELENTVRRLGMFCAQHCLCLCAVLDAQLRVG